MKVIMPVSTLVRIAVVLLLLGFIVGLTVSCDRVAVPAPPDSVALLLEKGDLL